MPNSDNNDDNSNSYHENDLKTTVTKLSTMTATATATKTLPCSNYNDDNDVKDNNDLYDDDDVPDISSRHFPSKITGVVAISLQHFLFFGNFFLSMLSLQL